MGKKKGAGNKLARMSEEERARYLQHRAEIEEEARRRKQQLIAIFMKNKLKREEAFSRLNLAKINQEWRTILRNIKCDELKEEIKVVEQYFDDALDRKNRVIQRLLSDLDENEELYSTVLNDHIRNIEVLIMLHADRIQFWKISYQNEKRSMLNQFQVEMQRNKERKLKSFRELECVYYGLENKWEKDTHQTVERHLKKVDDIKSGLIFQLQTITQSREHQMEKLWKEFQSVLNEYLKRTEEFHDEYLNLRQRDDEDTKIIRFHYAEVVKSTELISHLKLDLSIYRDKHRQQFSQLQRFKKNLQNKQINIKVQMDKQLEMDRLNMRHMVVLSNATLKQLGSILKRGESVLNIGGICRKLETEREKIVPFGSKQEEMFQNMDDDMRKPPNDITQLLLKDLENFWIRFNNARIDYVCLAEEKAMLKQENQQLKEQLKVYLTNVTIADGSGGCAIDKLRPTSMKVERVGHHIEFIGGSMKNINTINNNNRGVCRQRPVTCIEGNLCNAVRSRSLVSGRIKLPEYFSMINRRALKSK